MECTKPCGKSFVGSPSLDLISVVARRRRRSPGFAETLPDGLYLGSARRQPMLHARVDLAGVLTETLRQRAPAQGSSPVSNRSARGNEGGKIMSEMRASASYLGLAAALGLAALLIDRKS